MPTDAERIATIRSNALAQLETISASPKPSYNIDGQQVSWNEYQAMLQSQIEWADKQAAAYGEAWEVTTNLVP